MVKFMTQNEFALELIQKILDTPELGVKEGEIKYLTDGFEPDPDDKDLNTMVVNLNLKFNNVESNTLIGDFLLIYYDENKNNSCGRFSLADMKVDYERNGWDAVLDKIQACLDSGRHISLSGLLDSIRDYEAIKDRIIIRPINYTDNSAALEHCVYKRMEDFALCLYVFMSDDGDTLSTSIVSHEMFKSWNQKAEDVWNYAMANTQMLAPPRMYTTFIQTIDQSNNGDIFMNSDYKLKDKVPFHGVVVTTTRKVNGAIAMFYPGVQERLAELLGGSYYIVFTSIHEAHLHPYGSVRPSMVRDSLLSTLEAFPQDEILTRRVFLYDAKRKCIKVKA